MPISLFERLELMSLNSRFKSRGTRNPGNDVVIIDIDDKSIVKLGSWPWNRKVVAKIVDILSQSGAKAIGLDIIFSEEQVSSEKEVLSDVLKKIQTQKSRDNLTTLKGEIENSIKALDSDSLLAESFKKADNVVLAMSMKPTESSIKSENSSKLDNNTIEDLKRSAYFAYHGKRSNEKFGEFNPILAGEVLIPIEKLRSIDSLFVANAEAAIPDIDGVLRKESMVTEFSGDYYPPLSFDIYLLYKNYNIATDVNINFGMSVDIGRDIAAHDDDLPRKIPPTIDIQIPTDKNTRYFINYYGPAHTFQHYSCSDLIEGEGTITNSLLINGKAVFLGYAATGLGDQWLTPFGMMYGVEKQATIVQNFIDKQFLYHPQDSFWRDAAALLAIGLLLSFILPKLPPAKGSFFTIIICISIIALCSILFSRFGLWVNMVFPMLTVFVLYISITSYRFLTEEREKRKIKGAFQQYLSPSVVNAITKDPSKLKLGGEEKTLSILFSDIRGFTTLSESLTPAQLVQLLNEYFSEMTDVITEVNSGTLDKFIGDAIMAFWGAPVEMKDHALKSSLSALAMIERLKKLRIKWDSEGKPPVNIGIGINTGDVVVGNMGSDRRFDYTVMGDAVNLASRLEGLNKEYGTNIIISEFTKSELPDTLITREIDLVRVKGKLKPVKIYELMGESDSDSLLSAKAKMFEEGIILYRNRQWQEAVNKFKEIKTQFSDDGPSSVYIERCAAYMQSPPPDNWDGVFVMKTK